MIFNLTFLMGILIVAVQLSSTSGDDFLKIVERAHWGAQPPAGPLIPFSKIPSHVIISHTASEPCVSNSECIHRVRTIQTLHMEGLNWDDIAYNFLVGGDGSIYVGRGWDSVGAHSYGWNVKSIGLSFIGTFNTISPNQAQLEAAQKLLESGVKMGKLPRDYKVLGHRQVSETLSPGDKLFEIIKTWPQWSELSGKKVL